MRPLGAAKHKHLDPFFKCVKVAFFNKILNTCFMTEQRTNKDPLRDPAGDPKEFACIGAVLSALRCHSLTDADRDLALRNIERSDTGTMHLDDTILQALACNVVGCAVNCVVTDRAELVSVQLPSSYTQSTSVDDCVER